MTVFPLWLFRWKGFCSRSSVFSGNGNKREGCQKSTIWKQSHQPGNVSRLVENKQTDNWSHYIRSRFYAFNLWCKKIKQTDFALVSDKKWTGANDFLCYNLIFDQTNVLYDDSLKVWHSNTKTTSLSPVRNVKKRKNICTTTKKVCTCHHEKSFHYIPTFDLSTLNKVIKLERSTLSLLYRLELAKATRRRLFCTHVYQTKTSVNSTRRDCIMRFWMQNTCSCAIATWAAAESLAYCWNESGLRFCISVFRIQDDGILKFHHLSTLSFVKTVCLRLAAATPGCKTLAQLTRKWKRLSWWMSCLFTRWLPHPSWAVSAAFAFTRCITLAFDGFWVTADNDRAVSMFQEIVGYTAQDGASKRAHASSARHNECGILFFSDTTYHFTWFASTRAQFCRYLLKMNNISN